ncbi:YciI family protein [Alsobacter sp. R-9]
MAYVLLMYEPRDLFEDRAQHDKSSAYWGAWMDYIGALRASGLISGGQGLQGPAAAVTVSVADGRRQVQDGPYADTKEQLGGFFVLDTEDLDTALEWAARSPAATYGRVEVRPALPPMPAA